MKYGIYILLFASLLGWAGKPGNTVLQEDDWRFIGSSYGVNFYWKKDKTWDLLMIKAKNNSVSAIDYSYKYHVQAGSSVLDQGKHYHTRLTSKGENIIKINKNYSYMTHVTLKEIVIERNF